MTTTPDRSPYGSVRDVVFAADRANLSVKEASRLSGLSQSSIRSSAYALGITLRRERRPLGSIKALVQAGHAQGLTVPQLSESSGVSRHNLYTAAKRLGLALQPARRGPSIP
jgi:hypothetical protein